MGRIECTGTGLDGVGSRNWHVLRFSENDEIGKPCAIVASSPNTHHRKVRRVDKGFLEVASPRAVAVNKAASRHLNKRLESRAAAATGKGEWWIKQRRDQRTHRRDHDFGRRCGMEFMKAVTLGVI